MLGLLLLVFIYSIVARWQWFGVLSDDGNQWLTASTVKFLTHWYREGAFHLHFAMLENYPSIEFGRPSPISFDRDALMARDVYFSYPPGCLLIPYALSSLTGLVPTAAFVMGCNLVNQFGVAIVLLLLTRKALVPQTSREWLITLLAPLAYLLLPATMYWHQNVYFSDQAVIFWFVTIVWWVVTDKQKLSRAVAFAVSFMLSFMMAFSDWLSAFVLFSIFAVSITVDRQSLPRAIANHAAFIMGGACALALYAFQVLQLGSVAWLIAKLKTRTLSDPTLQNTWSEFAQKMTTHFGAFEFVLLFAGITALTVLKKTNLATQRILILLSAPCVMQLLVFRNHSVIHPFSALKLYPLFCFLFFACVPHQLSQILKSEKSRQRLVIGFALVLVGLHSQYPYKFQAPLRLREFYAALAAQARFDEVYVSDELEIADNPPQALSVSEKRVYRITSAVDFKDLQNLIQKNNHGQVSNNEPRFVLLLRESSSCRARITTLSQSTSVPPPKAVLLPGQIWRYEWPQSTRSWPCASSPEAFKTFVSLDVARIALNTH